MPVATQNDHGLVMRFEVDVGGYRLGSWSTCKGLDVTFKYQQVKELGQHAYSTFLVDRAEYSKVTLQRAMRAGDWEITKQWLETITNDAQFVRAGRTTMATITLFDARLGAVATWSLRNATPSAWRGPQLDAKGSAVALETLELVHEGFLDD